MEELEEMLIKAGVLEPKEAFKNKMRDSVHAFYDMTSDYYPELINKVWNKTSDRELTNSLKRENHNDMTFANSGRVIAALKELRKSRRRDSQNRDYLKN